MHLSVGMATSHWTLGSTQLEGSRHRYLEINVKDVQIAEVHTYVPVLMGNRAGVVNSNKCRRTSTFNAIFKLCTFDCALHQHQTLYGTILVYPYQV